MGTRESVLGVSFLLPLLVFATSQANARVYQWVDENGETHFGDRVPEQYRGDRQKVRVRSNTTQRNDIHVRKPNNPGHTLPRFDNPSALSDEELAQRIKEIEARHRNIEDDLRKQVSKERDLNRARSESGNTSVLSREKQMELEALKLDAKKNSAKQIAGKRHQTPKSYEQRMQEYKSNRHCFDAARNENGSINAATAQRLGCRDMKRPRRD